MDLSLLSSMYQSELSAKYADLVENKWVWFIFALVILAGIVVYAFYCTRMGRQFGFGVKFNWPRMGLMGIKCK
ncbi:MAG: hypothetical protein LBT80_05460 [Lactobacillaceae bacterium]|jgi:MFS superfamily sulfate permease-like transporter|nr:hypothetical protein [Lactobacillaceae bacterium]